MDSERFDALTRIVGAGSTRRVFGLGLGLLGVGAAVPLLAPLDAVEAKKGKKKKRKKKKKKNNSNGPGGGGTGTPANPKVLRQTCTPGKDTCSAGLQCDVPTTDHRCSSTVEGVSAWCCVPPGGTCPDNNCECCGNHQCSFLGMNTFATCVPR